MTDQAMVTVASAAAAYIQSLSPEQRRASQQELTKFVRWYGGDRPVDRLTVGDIDDYVEQVQRSQADPVLRLRPLKEFLNYLKRQGLVQTSLAAHVRIRRSTARQKANPVVVNRPEIELTPEGYARLQAELDELIALRPAIAEELQRAMADKDFRENAPLDAARERQGQIEARIRELERILKAAKVVQNHHVSGTRVGIGSTVVLRDETHGEELRYSLVGPNEANPLRGLISTASPIGRALLDRTVGEEFEVVAPAGTVRYRLLEIVKP